MGREAVAKKQRDKNNVTATMVWRWALTDSLDNHVEGPIVIAIGAVGLLGLRTSEYFACAKGVGDVTAGSTGLGRVGLGLDQEGCRAGLLRIARVVCDVVAFDRKAMHERTVRPRQELASCRDLDATSSMPDHVRDFHTRHDDNIGAKGEEVGGATVKIVNQPVDLGGDESQLPVQATPN